MRQQTTATILLIITLSTGFSPSSGEAGPTIHAQDSAHAQLAEWAVDRFAIAGLTVPQIEIHIHDSGDSCGGNRGVFNPTARRIDVCVPEQTVVLHEIAHAWARENLSDEQRAAYVAAGGFESWSDSGTGWSHRGSEDAADTIAWALMEQPITSWSPDGPIAERNDAFRMLTGMDAPRLQG